VDVRKEKLDIIINRLTYLQLNIKNRNLLNLNDINIYAENFYRDFLNKLGYSFKNTNYNKQNCAYIDLIDDTNKKAMQITAQNDNKKISKSIVTLKKKFSI
jgi:hypothetical protein